MTTRWRSAILRFNPAHDGVTLIHSFVINLATQPLRLESCRHQLAPLEGEVQIIDAVDGHASDFDISNFPSLNRGHWWGRDAYKPGAFACYLSHRKAWQSLAASGLGEALIVEDDVRIDSGRLLEVLGGAQGLSFDALFVNFGSVRYLEGLERSLVTSQTPALFSMSKTLVQMLERGTLTDAQQPGAYGYILRKSGADKLLAISEKDGIWMGVDFAIAFSTFGEVDLNTVRQITSLPSALATYLRYTQNVTDATHDRIILDARICTGPPPILPDRSFPSTIQHDVKRNFA